MLDYFVRKNLLDRLVRPNFLFFRRSWSPFQVCGYTGLAVAILLAMSLCARQGLSLWGMGVVTLAAVASFFGLALLVKVVTGEESLTYFHHQIAVLASAAGLLALLSLPVLPYLDATALGIGAFLVCGRVGCFLVGCCHGKPSRWGVCYRQAHAEAGFPSYYVGVRLFPAQLMESVWGLLVVLAGTNLVLRGSQPGTALAWYVTAYACGRFALEFLRGDPDRPYLWGFSEAQWTSLTLVAGVLAGGLIGLLPFYGWQVAAPAMLVAFMLGITLYWRFAKTMRHKLLHPRHIQEVAQIIDQIAARTGESRFQTEGIPIGLTSLGIQISASIYANSTGKIYHYSLSCRKGTMNDESAQILAGLICHLKHPRGAYELLARTPGIFHLLVRPV